MKQLRHNFANDLTHKPGDWSAVDPSYVLKF